MAAARRIRRTVVAAGLGAALAGGAAGAASQLRAAPQPRLVLDARGPLFDAANLLPGARLEACARVVNRGAAPGRVALSAPAIRGGLARHLELTVARPRSCASSAGPVLFRGRLADFAALSEPQRLEPGAARVYRFALVLADETAAEGLDARWDWRVAVEPTTRMTRCTRLRLLGKAVRTVRRRGRVVVRVRVARGRRLEVRTAKRLRWTRSARALTLGVHRVRVGAGSLRLRITTSGNGTCVVS